MQYRIAAKNDIELLMQSRQDVLRAVNELGEDVRLSDELLDSSRRFFLEGDQTTVIATEDGRVIGCATMCFLELMPTFSHPTGKRARLMNVFTDEAWRGKGIAYRMVSMVIGIAWDRGVTEISLDATEAGRPLYRKLGFRDSDECMVLTRD